MTPSGSWKVACEGDVGDLVILLGIISQLPYAPHELILRKSKLTKMRDDATLGRFHDFVQELAEAQPYIKECRVANGAEQIDWDSGSFRGTGLHSRSASLFDAQLSHLLHTHNPIGAGFTSAKAWLTAPPSKDSKNRVIIARSPRYRNGYFNWTEVVKHYGDKLLFVGLPSEYQDFTWQFGLVEYAPTATLMEVAKLIAGSSLFIGNQSSPMAVCEGLKHTSIQETSLDPADCIYNRPNAQYCYDGAMTLPDVDGSGEKHVPSSIRIEKRFNTCIVPPGGWQYPQFGSQNSFDVLLRMLVFNLKVSREEAAELIHAHNAKRLPDYFVSQEREQALRFVRPALENAKLTP